MGPLLWQYNTYFNMYHFVITRTYHEDNIFLWAQLVILFVLHYFVNITYHIVSTTFYLMITRWNCDHHIILCSPVDVVIGRWSGAHHIIW